MQNEPAIEQAVTMSIPCTTTPKPLSPTKDPQVQRTRKILMILIGVSLTLTVGSNTGVAIAESGIKKYTGNTELGVLIGGTLLSVCLDGFGLFVAYRYSATGLRVFAWLYVIMLVLLSILTGLFLFAAIVTLTVVNYASDELSTTTMGRFVLTVVTVLFAFKLVRLINTNNHLTTQQI